MNFQPKTVARPVKESNTAPFAYFSWKASLGEQILDRLVDSGAVRAILDPLQRQLLPRLHCLPELALRFASAPANHRPSEIAKVAGFRIARKHIENDERISLEGAGAALMWITCLIAAGHNSAVGGSARS